MGDNIAVPSVRHDRAPKEAHVDPVTLLTLVVAVAIVLSVYFLFFDLDDLPWLKERKRRPAGR